MSGTAPHRDHPERGSIQPAVRIGMAAWSMAQVDRETDGGYERTTTYEGHPAFESGEGYSNGEIQVLVG